MTFRVKAFLAFLAAVAVTQIVASIIASQFILAGLVDMGVPVPLATRLQVTATDIWRSAPLYWLLIVPSLLLSMLVFRSIKKHFNDSICTLLFALCCGILLWLVNTLLNNLLGVSLIAGFRGWGVLGLIVAGTFGGWCYRLLGPAHTN
ncbi:hypothetical protein QSV34_13060 [Porticoccus sp. W117]|uniref:hypothetical protein n=1 Tax=Porticoccus sp. W117 TaxID=3054777 RepID=UPI002597CE3B|nr:hypothetical protein [Porticoccus sp. W117]MDM3872278.1 hypothetical protein [Porticoccus sp. W117]